MKHRGTAGAGHLPAWCTARPHRPAAETCTQRHIDGQNTERYEYRGPGVPPVHTGPPPKPAERETEMVRIHRDIRVGTEGQTELMSKRKSGRLRRVLGGCCLRRNRTDAETQRLRNIRYQGEKCRSVDDGLQTESDHMPTL